MRIIKEGKLQPKEKKRKENEMFKMWLCIYV